ncbi:MAG: L-2-amino-thiazoline-4-carboxylic acid hydrolase [Spirochaetales bacterium]|nr:L-2-amino-thiazoline-4-carboxylic acid hydrolase [Spirochaetales bacterium]
MSENKEMVTKDEMITKIRAAIGDRATWFALLYEEFCNELPEEKVIELSRKAITKYGTMKVIKDPDPFKAKDWVLRHKEKGSADVFDSDIEYTETEATQRMKNCALVDAWKAMNYSPEKLDLFCDIAMDGDRGRAAGHENVTMELHETIGKGCDFCRLVIKEN